MGYWNTGRDGASFVLDLHQDGTPMTWGDAPADVMDTALQEIIGVFKEDLGRAPSLEELIAGLRFSAGGLQDDDLTDPAKTAERN